ncbi:MAG: hypothetical protein R6X34_28675, partial [Chloroflexota bacterium]
RRKASYRYWLSPDDDLNWNMGVCLIGSGVAAIMVSTIYFFEDSVLVFLPLGGLVLFAFSLYKMKRTEKEIRKIKDGGK